jgi:protein O-GlcNAc transferase
LDNGYVTFGCVQNLLKINDAVLASWGRILLALPQARLRIQAASMRRTSARDEGVDLAAIACRTPASYARRGPR